MLKNTLHLKCFKSFKSFKTLSHDNFLKLYKSARNFHFIVLYCDFVKLLQDLLKSSNEFVWLKVHDEAFKTLKSAIVKDVILKYFDLSLPIYIYTETDTSKKGIGVIMLQPDNSVENTSHTEVPNNLRPVFFASKTNDE